MQSSDELRALLGRIDRKSYPAYKETKGIYRFSNYVLSIDHVQGDPFAAPSKLSIHMEGKTAGFPRELYSRPCQRVALQDALIRRFAREAARYAFQVKGSGKSGLISISHCGPEVLERTACSLTPENGNIRLCLEVGFPANGRTVCARELEKILFDFLPECVEASLRYASWNGKNLQAIADLAEDQQFIRLQLSKLGLCAFVADGSILPRVSGVSSRPMQDSVPFCAPETMAVTLELPHRGRVRGMGIPKGVTLIVGGGYHGKSTLLKALELGVYNHIAGDGREYVITDASAVKIRAEDGRSIQGTDISMFINNLPNHIDTTCFTSADASGSTSQAANVIESMEAGSRLLLMDEDTSATNFMVRDALMQRVIHREMEPITPWIDRVRELYIQYGISTILVAGSSGAYFHVADHIIQMEQYMPREITELAKQAAQAFPLLARLWRPRLHRFSIAAQDGRQDYTAGERVKLRILGRDTISLDQETIDLRLVEQLCDSEQTAALGYCMLYAQQHLIDGKKTLREVIDELETLMDRHGVERYVKTEVASHFWRGREGRRFSAALTDTESCSWPNCRKVRENNRDIFRF